MATTKKITELTEDTAPTSDDLVVTVNDPGGTPASKKVSVLNLLKRFFLSDDTAMTWGAPADGTFLKRSGATVAGVAPASTDISDFAEAVEDKIGAKVIAGSGISVAYNDTTGETTVTNTSPDTGSPPTQEQVEDIVGALVVDSSSVNATYNDGAGTLTLEVITSSLPFEFTVAASDESTALATGAAKITFYFPVAVNITGVSAGLATQSSSGAVTIDVNKNGTTIFSTNPTIDANEDTTHTAATPSVLTASPTAFGLTDKVTIDIDGAGTGAKGLKVSFTGTRQ